MGDANQQPQPQMQMQMQPQPTMMMGPPMMAAGPCPMCGNPAPPMIIYEINATGYIIILVLLILGFVISGLIAACIICGDKQQPDSCHDPKAKCASCGALRMG